jgi:hypothetical protein
MAARVGCVPCHSRSKHQPPRLQADHCKQCRREDIVQQAAAGAGGGGSSSTSTGGAAAAAAGGSEWQDPVFAAFYKDPGDLSLKQGQTIK